MSTDCCKWIIYQGENVLTLDFSGISDERHVEEILGKIRYSDRSGSEEGCYEVEYSAETVIQVVRFLIPVGDKKIPAFVLADVTTEKKFDDILKKKDEEIKRLLQQKDDFILQIGHDLKTPLTPLLSVLPFIRQKITDPSIQELLDGAITNAELMRKQVENILKYAKIKAFGTSYSIKPVPLYSIVSQTIERFKQDLETKRIHVHNEIDDSLLVRADPDRIHEVFAQFLSNSIKFTKNKGDITIFAEKTGELITVSFQDTGVGLTKYQIDHIFDEFYKADDSRHDIGSSGLGLTMCKTIITKHGGDLWVFSQGDGKGVTFYFTLKDGTESLVKNHAIA